MDDSRKWIHARVRGSGTPEHPLIELYMPEDLMGGQKVKEPRRQACFFQVEAVARALGYTRACIRMWNHREQYEFDDDGRRIMITDKKGRKRPKLVPADSHITVFFYGEGSSIPPCNAHVYTVDDSNGVPQRIMLISERQYTGDHDRQSPQLWLSASNTYNRAWDHNRTYLRQMSMELRAEGRCKNEWMLFFVDDKSSVLDIVHKTYKKWLDDVTDEEALPEAVKFWRDKEFAEKGFEGKVRVSRGCSVQKRICDLTYEEALSCINPSVWIKAWKTSSELQGGPDCVVTLDHAPQCW